MHIVSRLSKSFGSVCRDLLLTKLSMMGFRSLFLSLLDNFMRDRYQYVTVQNFDSSVSPTKAGVPQGSILSPLLFKICVNDLSNAIPIKIVQYADDTVLVSRANHYSHAASLLQELATKAMDWFATSLIDINVLKTQLVCFRSP